MQRIFTKRGSKGIHFKGFPKGSDAGKVHVVIPPSHRRLPSLTGNEADQPPIPAVTVQAFDVEGDDEVGERDGQGSGTGSAKGKRDITQVKATVESMRGDGSNFSLGFDGNGQGKRITPTGRPPLA